MRYLEIPSNIYRASNCESTQSTTNIIPSSFACSTSYIEISDLDYAEKLYHRTVFHGCDTTTAAAAIAASTESTAAAVPSPPSSYPSSPSLHSPPWPPLMPPPGHPLPPWPPLHHPLPRPEGHQNPISAAPRQRQLRPPIRSMIRPRFPRPIRHLHHRAGEGDVGGDARIALECEKPPAESRPQRSASRLLGEPVWKMYCNGRQYEHAQVRECNESDWHVLSMVQRVSVGARVIPVVDDWGGSGREGRREYPNFNTNSSN